MLFGPENVIPDCEAVYCTSSIWNETRLFVSRYGLTELIIIRVFPDQCWHTMVVQL